MNATLIGTLAPGQHHVDVRVVDLPPILVDEATAAKLLNVSARTVFSLTDSGRLPCVRIGSRKLYRLASIHRFVDEAETTNESGVDG